MTDVKQRRCEWCEKPLPPDKSKSARTCSTPCRQAKHRFRIAPADRSDGSRRHFAYADPPYPGRARRYYKKPEVNHGILIGFLQENYPDGWALSTSAEALPHVLRLCPKTVRVCVWMRAARRTRRTGAHNAYEALIVAGGRPVQLATTDPLTDVLEWTGRQYSHPRALVGMKPAAFCEWMFSLLGARQGDRLDDIFPGSSAISRAWDMHVSPRYQSTLPSRLEERQRRHRNKPVFP